MSDISGLVQGLAGSINSYLGANQQQQRQQQNSQLQTQQNLEQYAGEKQIDKQNEDKADPTYVSPEMIGGMFNQVSPEMGQAASKFVQDYNTKNPDQPLTWDQTTQGLGGMLDKISSIQGKKNAASNTRHYLGNDPDGNAIFSDNNGKMYSPDGSGYSGKVLPKSSTMPTAQTRSTAEFATTILPHITEMRQLIQQADAKGYIGPASGRLYNQFMTGAVGSTGNDDADRLLGRLRAMDSLLKTGAMKVHFGSRGGQNMYEHFSQMLNTGKQSAAVLNGSLDTMEDFMKGYAGAGNPGASLKKPPTNDPLGIM